MMLSLFTSFFFLFYCWGNFAWGWACELVGRRQAERGEKRAYTVHTHILLWDNISVFGKGWVPPLPPPTQPITTFTVTRFSFMAACWERFLPQQEDQARLRVCFSSFNRGNAHRHIADHRASMAAVIELRPQKNESQPGAETQHTFCFCCFVLFRFVLFVWGGVSSLFFSAGIQTVFVEWALRQQVGPGRLLRNNWVTGFLTKLHFKSVRPDICARVQPYKVPASQRETYDVFLSFIVIYTI